MGCCMSTNKASSAGQKNHHHSFNDRECAPPSMEEETVKEVLSETPKPALAIAKIEQDEIKTRTPPKPALQKTKEEVVKIEKKSPVCVVADEISEVSEICSVSESVSTTTVTESRDDGEVKQRVDISPAKFPRNRSYSGDQTVKRERVVGRSPARRSDQSPARRSDQSPGRRIDVGVRSGFSREGNQARRRIGTNVHRRDPGESSVRRSRSPATRTDGGGAGRSVMGRSPSTGKSVQSPGRIRAAPLGKNAKVDDTSKEGKWPPSNESLENPLVSLECFIFL